MSVLATTPVLALLLYDLLVFLGAIRRAPGSGERRETLLLALLFFCSGMPALVYQIVWQRALFAIYGVNAESVAVVVSAFMLGLGLGSLGGGWLSTRFPRHAIVLFGLGELGIAAFGVSSLAIFHWAAAHTAGASLPYTIVFSLLLLIVPTTLMGATLPLLVEHLVRRSGRVGYSVATLYFVNTFGSAVACYLCAIFLLRDFGQSGSVTIAAGFNTLVGATALASARGTRGRSSAAETATSPTPSSAPGLALGTAMAIAGITGFVALGFEIAWFRVFALASSDRAPAFALLLSTYLAGVAAGSFIAGDLTATRRADQVVRLVGLLLLGAGAVSGYLPPLIATLKWHDLPYLAGAPAFFLTAGLLGSVLPLLCQLSIAPGRNAGRGVSLVYVANIAGSTLGSLLIGFVLMQWFGLREVCLGLGAAAVATGTVVLCFQPGRFALPSRRVLTAIVVAGLAVPAASRLYPMLFERLIFGSDPAGSAPLAEVVENRNGVICVLQSGAIFGGGVYDGYLNIDPIDDVNMVVRAYALSAFHPAPRRMLMIGLSSGSWGQILASHPQLETFDVVEINPGYLRIIERHAPVASLLRNPKVHIYIDDGRRWLLAHPEVRYDAIVENTSFHWRDHSSDLLSVDYLRIIRQHLAPGGVYYYNTTWSDDVVATGLSVFPYGLRVLNFLAVSDAPMAFDAEHWMTILRQYRIDDRPVFDPNGPRAQATLASYRELARSVTRPPVTDGIETSESLNHRLGQRLIITDDNMGWEWRAVETSPAGGPGASKR
jgi:spermidine synthase